jgi:hypothetical protein
MVTLGAVLLTLFSSAIKGTRLVVQDWDCTPALESCERPMVVAGFPLPYITDYHGLSPGQSADITGALLGVDLFDWRPFLLDAAIYLAVLIAVRYVLSLRKRRTA